MLGKFWDKISLTGWKCSHLNAPSTETPVSHTLVGESLFPFPSSFSGVIRNWTPQYENYKVGKILDQNKLNRWSRMNAPGTETPVSHSPLAHCVLQELSQFPDLFWPTKPHSTFTLTLGLAYYAIHRIRVRDNFLLEGIFDVGRDFSASSSSPSWDYRYTARSLERSTFNLQTSLKLQDLPRLLTMGLRNAFQHSFKFDFWNCISCGK